MIKKHSHAKITLTLMILVIKEILHNLILNSNTNHTSEQKPASTVQEHAS